MIVLGEERRSDSPLVESVTYGYTIETGTLIRPAEINWHMVITRFGGNLHTLVVGPWMSAGPLTVSAGAEIVWIKFRLGAFLSHRPTRSFLDSEMMLPAAASHSFWLNSTAWQYPTYDNADTFVSRLVRQDVLAYDPAIEAALQDRLVGMASRTVRHRFLQATGLTQSHIRQYQRAQQAASLLQQGRSILDTVYEAGYFDQPHLTRSLKQFTGFTPAQLLRLWQPPDCHSVQDPEPALDYDSGVVVIR